MRPGKAGWVFLICIAAGLTAAACREAFSGARPPSASTLQPASSTNPPAPAVILPVTSETLMPATSSPEAPAGTPTPVPSIWVAPYLPVLFQQGLSISPGLPLSPSEDEAGLRVDVGMGQEVSHWIYALVAPFPTVLDGLPLSDLQSAWAGQEVEAFGGQPVLMDIKTVGVFEAWWGRAAPGRVKVVAADELVDYAWENRPILAVVPFEHLEPRWKVLEVDGQSPVRRDFNSAAYPLAVPFSISGPAFQSSSAGISAPSGNWDPERMTVLVLTGVTALVRGTSNTMYSHGSTYPAEEIGPWLRQADLTHISNEIPFVPDCPLYDNTMADLRFCTHPSYITLLEEVGTDIVELTGDHFGDWGPEATLFTLELYNERGWPYYGGGANLAEARRPVLSEHNGNRLAFIGCNAKGGGYALADDNTPGAGECDFGWMETEIARLRQDGYLPVVTLQHDEIYAYMPPPEMQADFIRLARAGAVIVSGSQAHQPHGMAFEEQAFLHFGLGNLFFDQFNFFEDQITDRAFIDRHIFYGGRYISTELLTIQFVDLARSRPMNSPERESFLRLIFDASLW